MQGIRAYGGSPLTLLGQFPHHFAFGPRIYTAANSEGFGKGAAIPRGYYAPSAIAMPVTAGQMSSFKRVNGSGTAGGTLWAVKAAAAALTGSGTLSGTGGLIVQLFADLVGSGTVTAANAQAFLAAVANLTGSGGITDADLEGLGALVAALVGSGTADASTLTGTGELTADLVVTGTGLSTANVGQAVWAALAAVNNGTGTMGEKLNDAGSASNPWTEVIESGYSAAEVLRLILAFAANNAEGLEGPTPVFKSVDGTKNRITATYVDGERTVTARDAT
jgi:hypothetical protein